MKREEIKEKLKNVPRHDEIEEYYDGQAIDHIDIQFKDMMCGFPQTKILMIETSEDKIIFTIKINKNIVECKYPYEQIKKFDVKMEE